MDKQQSLTIGGPKSVKSSKSKFSESRQQKAEIEKIINESVGKNIYKIVKEKCFG